MGGAPRLLIACAAAANAHGALAGLPQPPSPGPPPTVWLSTSNDNLGGAVLDRDDFRTGALSGGATIGHWALGFDASMLTNKATTGGTPSRIDELTGSLGWSVGDHQDGHLGWSWLATAGGGVRAFGDFGGQRFQDALHRRSGYRPLDLPYDRERAVDALGFVLGRVGFSCPTSPGWSFFAPAGRWGFTLGGASLATTGGELEAEAELDAVYSGADGSTWLGTRFRASGGTPATPTAEIVAHHEDGPWLVTGATIEPAGQALGALLTAGVNPQKRAAYGTIGIDWLQRPPAVGEVFAVEQDVGYYSGAVVGFQYRWQPLPLREAGPEWVRRWVRSEVLIDYRFGGTPNYGWRDIEVLSDQALAGFAPTITPPPLFGVVRLMPYGYAALGVRIERLAAWGPQPRFPEQSATRGVTQIGCGLRLAPTVGEAYPSWKGLDRWRLGAGYDRWFPWQGAAVSNGTDHDEFQRTNWAVGGYVGLVLDW
jgi:hypothetical protein